MLKLVSEHDVFVASRLADCASPVLSRDRIQRALEQIESIEKLNDIRDLTRTLT